MIGVLNICKGYKIILIISEDWKMSTYFLTFIDYFSQYNYLKLLFLSVRPPFAKKSDSTIIEHYRL